MGPQNNPELQFNITVFYCTVNLNHLLILGFMSVQWLLCGVSERQTVLENTKLHWQ